MGSVFNGSSQYLITNSDTSIFADLFYSGGCTVCVWIKPSGWGSDSLGKILSKLNGSNKGWELYVSQTAGTFGNTAAIGFSMTAYNPTSDLSIFSTPTSSINLDTYYHVAVSFNADDDANDAVMYLNGVSQTVSVLSRGNGLNQEGDTDLYIGARGGSSSYFEGEIEDLRFYSGILSASKIMTIATARGQNDIVENIISKSSLNGGAPGSSTPITRDDDYLSTGSQWLGIGSPTYSDSITVRQKRGPQVV